MRSSLPLSTSRGLVLLAPKDFDDFSFIFATYSFEKGVVVGVISDPWVGVGDGKSKEASSFSGEKIKMGSLSSLYLLWRICSSASSNCSWNTTNWPWVESTMSESFFLILVLNFLCLASHAASSCVLTFSSFFFRISWRSACSCDLWASWSTESFFWAESISVVSVIC